MSQNVDPRTVSPQPGGAPAGATPAAPAASPVQPPAAPVTPATPPAPEVKKEYTQAELDAMFAERASRAKASATSGLLADLGVQSAEELKTFVASARETERARMTEIERAKADAQAAAARATEAERGRAQALDVAREAKLLAEATLIASKAGFDPDAVPVLVRALDRSKIVEQDGKLTGLDAAINEVAASLKVSSKPLPPSGPGTPAKSDGRRGSAAPGKPIRNKPVTM